MTLFVACVAGTMAGAQQAPEASQPSAAPAQAPDAGPRPLEGLAGQHVLVLPVQYVTFSDTLGWSGKVPGVKSYAQTMDDEITFALRERGLQANWIFSDAVTRSAERNVGFAVSPHAIEAGQLRIGGKANVFQLAEPLASQLRSLIALNDARYVLFPVEVRFSNADGMGQAMLHVVVVDARRSQVQWSLDVPGAPLAAFSPAIAADLASRLADLIAPPQ